jgi:hypothetical protein
MHNFTRSFLSQITGNANGDLRLAGTLDNINLTGELVVGGNLTVESLNTTYYIAGDTVKFIPDDIQLHRLRIHDKDGNLGYLSGGIHHRHLTSLSFDLVAETDKLLAYDFPTFGESLFYGTIYASGNVTIQGRTGEVTIDCNVTPLKNSFFVFNAANPDGQGLEVILPAQSRNELEQAFSNEVVKDLSKGIEVKNVKGLANGFQIGPKDGGYRISFTADDFTGLIGEYLRPASKKILFGK